MNRSFKKLWNFVMGPSRSQTKIPKQILNPKILEQTSKFKLIHCRAIQPLNPKNLRSTFSPGYSRTPISIGINDHLFKEPKTSFG